MPRSRSEHRHRRDPRRFYRGGSHAPCRSTGVPGESKRPQPGDAREVSGKSMHMQNTELAVKTGETAGGAWEKKTAGDYEISYRIGPAKGLYEFSAGKLEWKE